MQVTHTLRYGVGVELPTGLERFQIIGSFFGNAPLEDDVSDLANYTNYTNPREILGGLQFLLPANLVASIGGGAGISKGIGSPKYRAFASIGYTPMTNDDLDGDGILNDVDQCPNEAEDMDDFEDTDGCPDLDNDNDGILDMDDQCPVEPEDVDTFEDEDGCPDPDNDQDGVLDVEDKCPLEAGLPEKQGCPFADKDKDGIEDSQDLCPDDPEDVDTFEDEDGCPDPDNDKDTILDVKDQCPNKPETYNGKKDDDGCPDGAETVVITKTEVRILQQVFFDTGKSSIKSRSYTLLDTVATVLNQNPQITKIRVEGHTDDIGKDEMNMELSKSRAASVRSYLEKKGVSPARLVSEGYGEDAPLCKDIPAKQLGKKSRKYNKCRADNRRVEFKILELDGKRIKADESVTIEKKEVIEQPAP